jgi:hypothetical protein
MINDPTQMSCEEITTELADLSVQLREREGLRWLLEARRWRLGFELRYRERANGQS